MSLAVVPTYKEWRLGQGGEGILREDGVIPSERLLQTLWQYQRLQRDQLRLGDGRPLQVIHPGFLNQEAGPDFRQAILRIGDECIEGDVEIEIEGRGWSHHGHATDPAFQEVRLLASWHPLPECEAPCPQLDLSKAVDSSVSELSATFAHASLVLVPEEWKGQCAGPLASLGSEQRIELLREAAECRLDMKAAAILARSRVTGWTQALYEALFRGLGYKQNTWAMQCLAESIVPSFLRKESLAESPEHLQAILLGVAGLLPHNTTKTLDPFLKKLWAIWWRERSTYESRMLPKKAWRFHGIRPANHPQRRLALAAHWVARQDLARHLDDWFHSEDGTSGLPLRLNQILNPENPEFWSHHWTFRAPRIPGAQKMLGSSRTTDLAINAILPWFRARALSGNNSDLSQKVRDIYFNWPAAQDNLLLRKTRQRLIPGMLPRKIDSASLQQGLIQIASDFCSHTNAACEDCRFPELVRAMARGPEGE